MRAFNLIPPEQRRGAGGIAGRTGGIVYVVLATLVALVVLGVVYAVAVHDVASQRTTLAEVNDENAVVTSQVASLQPYVAFQSVAQQRISSVASLAAQRFDWPRAMSQIALSLPANVTLTELAGTASGGAGTASASGATGATGVSGSTGTTASLGVTVNAPSISINGCAAGSASKGQLGVAQTLSRFRALEDVSSASVSTYSSAACSGVSFVMTIQYATGFGIPAPRLAAGPETTVGG